MTDKLYVGTPQDCNAVRIALDFATDMPVPGTVNGIPTVDSETREAMRAQWWAMPQASRDSIIANPVAPWVGWTFQATSLEEEPSPGTRCACWIPADMEAVIQTASAAGRTLSLAQLAVLDAASLAAYATHPANWVFPQF
jgi:hypothetical protein